MKPPLTLFLNIVRVVGLLSRAVAEASHHDFINGIFELRKLCDVAIQQHTFKVVDIEENVDDDEL